MAGIRQVRLVVGALRRKSWMLSKRVPRAVRRVVADQSAYTQRPPVVVTTVPKSGTHLVHQIVCRLPGTVDYGTFIATTVSYRRRPRSVAAQVRRIRAIAPGEIVRAHLVHRPEIVQALKAKNAVVVFVYRDPRDVVVSEAHYINDLAPWHTMHRAYAQRTPTERIDLAIGGLPEPATHYPDVGARFDEHASWMDDADVPLAFEDLVSPDDQRTTVRRLVDTYGARAAVEFDVDEVTGRAIAAIDPGESHTFREGKVGGWRTGLSPEQLKAFDAVASHIVERFDYPPTFGS